MDAMETIRHRRSVRTFDGSDLRGEDAKKIMEYANTVTNPYNIPVKWKLLNAKEDELTTPVIVGTNTFIAGKIGAVPHAEEAFGYSFERVLLYADSINIGTTWIAGTMNRPAFEAAAGLKEGEIMPAVSPLGYPAKKMSLRESAMRKGIKADSRLKPDRMFFDETFETAFDMNGDSWISDLFEMIRWAPSAVNKQPWRIVKCGKEFHFYEKRDKGYIDNTGFDLQKVDIGIAMSHFTLGLNEQGQSAELLLSDPAICTPQDTFYVATYRL